MNDGIPAHEARDEDRQEEADRYQEWLDQQLVEEHEAHPERFTTVHPLTRPPATPTTGGAGQKGVDEGG